jgi:small multidrug resistance pump
MFLTLALFSTLGYAIQTFLMASYYRRFNALATASARGLSLSITMMPVLFLSKEGGFALVLHQWPLLLLAGAFATLGNWCAGISYRYLPVGIATAIQQGLMLIAISILGIFIFGEIPGREALLGILVIIISNAVLTTSKGISSSTQQQYSRHPLKGLAYCAGYSLFLAGSAIVVSHLSRTADPLSTGYLWESLIGVLSLLILAVKGKTSMLIDIPKRDLLGILICSSPTAIGTGCFLIAVTLGPISLLSAIVSNTVILISIFAFVFYREKLTLAEIFAILLMVSVIVYLHASGAV